MGTHREGRQEACCFVVELEWSPPSCLLLLFVFPLSLGFGRVRRAAWAMHAFSQANGSCLTRIEAVLLGLELLARIAVVRLEWQLLFAPFCAVWLPTTAVKLKRQLFSSNDSCLAQTTAV
mmetsp:Transcript_45688/g.93467  ORF Transcript_45688/g.93467 Transcript_45688/m.93467 type:complete len:120 (+) Transcript_45688:864-1223(+)